MESSTLKDLIPFLAQWGVSSIEFDGLKLAFKDSPSLAPSGPTVPPRSQVLSGPQGVLTEKIADMVVPQGLEEEMPYDKVLNWSSPTMDDGPVPLTNDIPLSEQPQDPIPDPGEPNV